MDATLVTARSDKEGAAPTWKKGYDLFHPLGAWCANTRECLAMLLRPGNAGSNTFTDHKDVLATAIRQIPARLRRKVLVRVDGAGASHELVRYLLAMSSPRRTVLFTCGWMITDEDTIGQVPAAAWKPGTGQDGAIEEDKDAAEITHLMSRAGNWPGGLRWIARRVKPSRRQMRNLTSYEKKTGWRYSIICTNIPDGGIPGVPGSHHPQYIDVAHREHAVVETRGVRTAKAMGLRTSRPTSPPGPASSASAMTRTCGKPIRKRSTTDLAHPRSPCAARPRTDPEDQPGLALEGRVPHLLATALRPASTSLTSTTSPSDTKGGTARCGRSRCAPGTPGTATRPSQGTKQTTRSKPGTSTISNQTWGTLND